MKFFEQVLLEAEDIIPDPAVRAKLLERLDAAVPYEVLAMAAVSISRAVLVVQRARHEIVSTADTNKMSIELAAALLHGVGSVLGLELEEKLRERQRRGAW